MSTPPPWTLVLQRIIKSTPELERLATTLGVNPTILIRWASGDFIPERAHLVRLVQVFLPQHRQELIEALEIDYPNIQAWLKDDIPEKIPSSFFAQVLNARATTADILRFPRISDMILKQALTQLDPSGLGMAITIAQCMPPSAGGKIRSLRERVGRGTPPWDADLEALAIFLGMESLAGFTAELRHVLHIPDLRKDSLLPAYRTEYEVSTAAHPIWFAGRIAGCLAASSTQEGHFTQQRLALLGTFSDLLSLAFDENEFYPTKLVELRVMPNHNIQRSYISTFRERVSKLLANSAHYHLFEAEQQAWREIEAIFFSLPDDAYNLPQPPRT